MRAPSDPPSHAWAKRVSALALIIANLVVVALALRDRWGYLQILYVCWFEAIIIGVYNLLKLVVVVVSGNAFRGKFASRLSFENRMAFGFFGLLGIGFYVVKYAGFIFATGLLLLMLPAVLQDLETGRHVTGSGQLTLMSDGFQGVAADLPIILLGLVISHGISFIVNFLARREYRRTNIAVLLFWPYARMGLVVAVMVVAGIAAAVAPPLARTSVFAVGVVFFKVGADLISHAFEHSLKPAVPPRIPVSRAKVSGAAA